MSGENKLIEAFAVALTIYFLIVGLVLAVQTPGLLLRELVTGSLILTLSLALATIIKIVVDYLLGVD